MSERVHSHSTTRGAGAFPNDPSEEVYVFPASFAQERMWYLQQLAPESPAYNVPLMVTINGPLDVASLKRSLISVAQRHEALRSTLVMEDGEVRQVVRSLPEVSFRFCDLSRRPAPHAEAVPMANQEARGIFKLEAGPLWRVALFRTGESSHLLVVTSHHGLVDGWSLGILMRELAAFYGAARGGTLPTLPALPIQYADYAVWQRRRMQGERPRALLRRWAHHLKQVPPVAPLPTERPRPSEAVRSGARKHVTFPPSLSEAVRRLGRDFGTTLFVTLLAAFEALLFRYGGETDFFIGTAAAGRGRDETQNLIGCFINTLLLRAQVTGAMTFRELLSHVREATLEAHEYQDIPFEALAQELGYGRQAPLFQCMFLVNNPQPPLNLPGLELTQLQPDTGSTKFDLTLAVDDMPGGFAVSAEYDTDLLSRARVEALLGHWRVLLSAIAADPDRQINSYPLLTDSERRRALGAWNPPATDARRQVGIGHAPAPLPTRFAEQVTRTPDAVAVAVAGGGEAVTYRQLEEFAERVARCLRERGVGPGAHVGVRMNRTPAMVAALLGVLKSGAAYVPLDPSYPAERLAFMQEDAGLTCLLTERSVLASLPRGGPTPICVEPLIYPASSPSPLPEGPPHAPPAAGTVAYLIYTSGSSGKPKGTQVSHAALSEFFSAVQELIRLGPEHTMLAVSSISFDIAALEIFLPLLVGARCVLAGRGEAGDGRLLARALAGVTHLQATPTSYRLLVDSGWSGDGTLTALCGGEPLDKGLADQFAAGCAAVWNLYGPTEATIWSAAGQVDALESVVNVGRPLSNAEFYILDSNMEPLPIGIPGELYIGGAGLAHGYHRRPGRTAERFIPNPFSPAPGARLYRTGDRARFLFDGRVEILGRVDRQVKVRGVRVEPGEVEAVLGQHPGVKRAIVLPVSTGPNQTRLTAFYTVSSGQAPAPAALRSFLSKHLPEAMIPTRFIVLAAFPLQPNGKLDLSSLADRAAVDDEPARQYVPPRTELESLVARIWADCLELERVGRDEQFTDLGGHSMSAARILSRIRRELQIELPLPSFFEASTVAQLAAVLERHLSDTA